MKKTLNIITHAKALMCALFMTGAFLILSANAAQAQESANGTVNPYTHIAEKLTVSAYPLGEFERNHTMSVLENILAGLKQTLSNGGGTQYQKLKYDFCTAVLSDISTRYIATEISLLTSLSGLDAVRSRVGTQQSQLAALYNEVVAQIQ